MVRFFGLLVAGMLSFTPQTSAQEVAAAEAIQPLVVKFYDITPLVTPGSVILNSLVTTVETPSKWPGR